MSTFLLLGAPASSPNVLTVHVADATTGSALSGTYVQIPKLQLAATTDSFGNVAFRGLSNGIIRLSAAHTGYARREVTVVVGLSDSTSVVVLLGVSSQQLSPVTVTAAPLPEYLRAFEVRRAQGLGRFLTEVQLDSAKLDRVADLIARRFPGVRAEWDPYHMSVSFGRAGYVALSSKSSKQGCAAQVYIDDMFAQPGEVGALMAVDVAGVEYHSNAPPVQYRRAGSQCGVILIWTKK